MIASISFIGRRSKNLSDSQLNVYLDVPNGQVGFDIDGETDIVHIEQDDIRLLIEVLEAKLEIQRN